MEQIEPPSVNLHDGNVLRIEWGEYTGVTSSSFPDPLTTIDYNEDGKVVAITFVGPRIAAIESAIEEGRP